MPVAPGLDFETWDLRFGRKLSPHISVSAYPYDPPCRLTIYQPES